MLAAAQRPLIAVIAALFLSLSSLGGAFAQDPKAVRASAFAMTGDAKSQTISMTFDRDPDLRWFLLRNPYRMVLETASAKFVFDPDRLKPNRMIESVRFGDAGEGRSRLILASPRPFKLAGVEAGDPDPAGAVRFSMELQSASAKDFDAALAEQQMSTASTKPADAAATEGKRFKVVLDAGHGGIDGGAKGGSGVEEKEVTLTFARELKLALEASGRYEVLMTRDDDTFIRLNDRVAFARKNQADLFVSIHADTIRFKGVRGATVYTVSDEASDDDSAALADRENLADQVAGVEIAETNPDVADILVELIRRETHGFSVGFARQLVDRLSNVTGLIKNPHRHAGFRVLRAPDVPSVLVELGYLSNDQDEAQLLDSKWRGKMVDSMTAAIDAFSSAHAAARNSAQ